MDGNILVARETAMFVYEGERVYIHEGVTRVREGHPMLEGREHLFKPIDVHWEIETARSPEPVPQDPPTASVVRSWALEQGLDVPERGRLPEAVVEAYTEAHRE